MISLLACIFLHKRVHPTNLGEKDCERLLVQDHSSPVGFRVPNIPSFHIESSIISQPGGWSRTAITQLFGGFCALLVGGGIIFCGIFGHRIGQFACTSINIC